MKEIKRPTRTQVFITIETTLLLLLGIIESCFEDVSNEPEPIEPTEAIIETETIESSSEVIETVETEPIDNPTESELIDNIIEETFPESINNLTNFEKALILHDYVLSHVEYYADYEETGPHKENEGTTAYSVITEGKGLCSGYSDLLNKLYLEVGLESHIVYEQSTNHEWVIVKIENEYYNVDPTWDDLQTYYRHYYFLCSNTKYETPKQGDPHKIWLKQFDCISERYDETNIQLAIGEIEYDSESREFRYKDSLDSEDYKIYKEESGVKDNEGE